MGSVPQNPGLERYDILFSDSDVFSIIEIPVFLGGVEGQVRFEKATGQKKRLTAFFHALEIGYGFVRDLTIRIGIVGNLGAFEYWSPFLSSAYHGFGLGVQKGSPSHFGLPWGFAPASVGSVVLVMKDLTVGNAMIAGSFQFLGHRHGAGGVLFGESIVAEESFPGGS